VAVVTYYRAFSQDAGNLLCMTQWRLAVTARCYQWRQPEVKKSEEKLKRACCLTYSRVADRIAALSPIIIARYALFWKAFGVCD